MAALVLDLHISAPNLVPDVFDPFVGFLFDYHFLFHARFFGNNHFFPVLVHLNGSVFVLIVGDKLVGTFDTFEAAADEGLASYAEQDFSFDRLVQLRVQAYRQQSSLG